MKRLFIAVIVGLILIGSVTAATYLIKSDGDPAALNNAAYYAYHEGDLERAEALYLSALALDPTYENAHYNLALLYFEQGRFDDAHEHFAYALTLDDSNPHYHFDYAANYVARFRQADEASVADFDHAIEHYMIAEALEPGFPHAQQNIDVLTQIKHEFFG
ncbi:tetratricopeptide repeat protein [Candidatus Woesearchaeota archaeon]|nr:tetratricopeptide repeat protein [Candidatus Woesearchaeota archaeon]